MALGGRRRLDRALGRPLDPPRIFPRRWLSTADYVARSGSRWHPVRPSEPTTLPPARRFGSRTADFASALDPVIPDLGVLEAPEAFLVGARGWVISRDGDLLPESSFFGTRHVDEMRPALEQPRSVLRLKGTCISLATDSAIHNYGHFLLDSVGRVDLIERAGFALGDADHVYAAIPSRRVIALLERLGVPPERLVLAEKGVAVRADLTLVPSFPGARRNYPAWLVAFLRQRLGVPSAATGRRLYIPRTTHRLIANEEALVATLSQHGFEVFEPTAGEDPRKAFAEAAIVVGGHGAGLADLAFCRPGTAVLELLPETHAMPFFYTLAGSAGLEYGYLVGPAMPPANARAHPRKYDFRIDEAEFRVALDAMLAVSAAGTSQAPASG
jgi:capsular polysaccharide biosynthesis protein